MYVGMFPNNTEHRHHVLQIEIGIKTSFRLRIDGRSYDYRAVIIAPNVPHQVDDHDEWQLMLHIDPESLAAKQLLKTYLGNRRFKEIEFNSLRALLPKINTYVHCTHPCKDAKKLFDEIVSALLDSPLDPIPSDHRIKAAAKNITPVAGKKNFHQRDCSSGMPI